MSTKNYTSAIDSIKSTLGDSTGRSALYAMEDGSLWSDLESEFGEALATAAIEDVHAEIKASMQSA